MNLTKSQLIELMNNLPEGTRLFCNDTYDNNIYWDAKKQRFTWEGWSYYNDDYSERIWDLKNLKRITMREYTLYLETDREIRMNDKPGNKKDKSYYLEFSVYFPAKNLNLILGELNKS